MSALVAADPVGIGRLHVLERQLHMIEPRVVKFLQALFVEQDARGDEIGIEVLRPAMGDDFGKIGPGRRLAAREMHLENAQLPPPR